MYNNILLTFNNLRFADGFVTKMIYDVLHSNKRWCIIYFLCVYGSKKKTLSKNFLLWNVQSRCTFLLSGVYIHKQAETHRLNSTRLFEQYYTVEEWNTNYWTIKVVHKSSSKCISFWKNKQHLKCMILLYDMTFMIFVGFLLCPGLIEPTILYNYVYYTVQSNENLTAIINKQSYKSLCACALRIYNIMP